MSEQEYRDELGLSRETLDAFEPLAPPDDFAEKLVAKLGPDAEAKVDAPEAHSTAPLPPGRQTWYAAAAAIAACIVVAIAVLMQGTANNRTAGSLNAERRETVTLGSRAVAVAEAGAELRWTVDAAGAGLVEQQRGTVFYRVERDADQPFVVATPAGEVRVRGTSFHVEVDPMGQIVTKRNIASATVGAVIAAAIVVTVYEGRVALANERGETELGPGEVAWAEVDGPPSEAVDVASLDHRSPLAGSRRAATDPAGDDESATAPELRQRLAALRAEQAEEQAELEALRARVQSLENAPDSGPTETQRLRRNPWYPPTSEDLEELVEQCGIRSDVPPVMGLEPGHAGENAEALGLSEGEVPIVNDAIRRLHQQYNDQLRELYLEATGDERGAQSLSAEAMMAQINAAALPGEVREAHLQVARERAGQLEAPADLEELSPATRSIRLHAGLGDEFQRLLAAELGEDRAHELRAAQGGWPWSRSYSRACQ